MDAFQIDPFATSHFSNLALKQELETVVARDHRSTAIVLSRIAEFDERRLYEEDDYKSMFAYCVSCTTASRPPTRGSMPREPHGGSRCCSSRWPRAGCT